MSRIKKGDLVLVCSGADAGKRGRVLRVIPGKDRAVIEGVSVRFKHLRKSQKHPQGGRVQRETPLHLSKLMPIDPSTDEATRVSYRMEGEKKVRVARGSGSPLEGQKATKQQKSEGKAKSEAKAEAKAEAAKAKAERSEAAAAAKSKSSGARAKGEE
jgi:large subunit ribosomal protein L24